MPTGGPPFSGNSLRNESANDRSRRVLLGSALQSPWLHVVQLLIQLKAWLGDENWRLAGRNTTLSAAHAVSRSYGLRWAPHPHGKRALCSLQSGDESTEFSECVSGARPRHTIQTPMALFHGAKKQSDEAPREGPRCARHCSRRARFLNALGIGRAVGGKPRRRRLHRTC